MSYILDALKKADAERARDAAAVPDLYAQGDAAVEGARTSSHGLKWSLLALMALLLAGLAWLWSGATSVEPARSAESDRSPAPVTVQAPPPVAPPVPHAVQTPAMPPPPRPSTASAAPSPPAPKPRLSAPAASPTPLATLAELPAELRAQLPALAAGGSVYSPAAANRIVILNGQVFREGDQPAEGLTVEQIGLKSTVLVFRGVRFELKH